MRHIAPFVLITLSFLSPRHSVGQEQCSSPACVVPARQIQCSPEFQTCKDFDAIVFVHGIYGDAGSFTNPSTGFNWPKQYPTTIANRRIDVFRLNYSDALASWAHGSNPSFEALVDSAYEAMKPLRKRQYRSIGFIAHSLGGNVVSTYLQLVLDNLGHPQRAENAFVITLGTPVFGAQIADVVSELKSFFFMSDPILNSLKKDNLYLTMLKDFNNRAGTKGVAHGCRPVHLYAAIEEKYVADIVGVVSPDSSVTPITGLVSSPIVGFPLNHLDIAKPTGPGDQGVYDWAETQVEAEYQRLAAWDQAYQSAPPSRRLCRREDFISGE